MARIHAIATMHRRDMNRTEERYAAHLRDRQMVGEIRWFFFEAIKLRLADNTFYTPDFLVVDNALALEAHEVKTEWGTGRPGWQEDARVKIKVAAEIFPLRFMAATYMRDGHWEFEEFGKDREEPAPPYPSADLSLISEALGWARQGTVESIVSEILKLRGLPHV